MIRIPGEGGLELSAVFDEIACSTGAAPGAVVCHPHPAFGGRMTTPLVVALHQALVAAGFSTLRFNFRGLDGSTGTPTGGLAEWADVASAVDYVAARAPSVALVGYSFGALMAARAVANGVRVTSLAAVGFPTTIIGADPDRLAEIEQALVAGQPTLFLQGDQDRFCKLSRIEAFGAGHPSVTIETLPGVSHFPAGSDEDHVVARVAAFTRDFSALTRA